MSAELPERITVEMYEEILKVLLTFLSKGLLAAVSFIGGFTFTASGVTLHNMDICTEFEN